MERVTGFILARPWSVIAGVLLATALLGFQLGGIVGHKFLSRYRVGIDLEHSVLRLKQIA